MISRIGRYIPDNLSDCYLIDTGCLLRYFGYMNVGRSYFLIMGLVAGLILSLAGCERRSGSAKSDNGATKKSSQPSADSLDLGSLKNMTEEERRIAGITLSERMIQGLSSKVKLLVRSFKETELDVSPAAIDQIELNHALNSGDLNGLGENAWKTSNDLAGWFYWPLSDEVKQVSMNQIWGPITDNYRFEDAQLGTLKGAFSESGDEFLHDTKFEGRIVGPNGHRFGLKGKQQLRWREVSEGDWKVVGWKQKELKIIAAPEPLFENVTEQAFPDEELFKRISRASHVDRILAQANKATLHPGIAPIDPKFQAFVDWESTGHYPCVSVVDFDNDGDDDVFLTDRWQSPSLLENQGDGTFADVTEEVGLSFGEYVTCAYFFDYDNDGDADLLVGHSVKPSVFYTNESGRFTPHDAINEVLDDARVVVAIAGADVNRDGLLDLYLCTYPHVVGPAENWIEHVARPIDRVKTRMAIEQEERLVDRGGSPNILLMNRGNTFEWSEIGDDLKQYRRSYQATWIDIDSDGDLDLYVCNDFAPDVFLRNDTERGSFEPKFVNVTKEIAPTVTMGFGMGISPGDFDNDADLDLYVSNMYSKAGNRILAQLDEVDERLIAGAQGNFLYENMDGEYQQVAGQDDDQQHVNLVGWSFGGQFADFDNDGHLDVYVPSGYYSAPKPLSTDIDL